MIESRIRGRGAAGNPPNRFERMRGSGEFADTIGDLFEVARRRAGLERGSLELPTAAFRRPDRHGQIDLFAD